MHRSIQNILDRRAVLTGGAVAPLALTIPDASASQAENPYSVEAVSARVSEFCKATGAPPLDVIGDEEGYALVTQEMLDWCRANGASIDWIGCGNLGPMFRLARDHYQRVQPRQDLTDAEVADLLEEIHAAPDSESLRLIDELGKTNAPAVIQRALSNALAAGVSS